VRRLRQLLVRMRCQVGVVTRKGIAVKHFRVPVSLLGAAGSGFASAAVSSFEAVFSSVFSFSGTSRPSRQQARCTLRAGSLTFSDSLSSDDGIALRGLRLSDSRLGCGVCGTRRDLSRDRRLGCHGGCYLVRHCSCLSDSCTVGNGRVRWMGGSDKSWRGVGRDRCAAWLMGGDVW
jgi:hypothetical protein